MWLVAATKAGYERSIYYPGGSMIVDPKGGCFPRSPTTPTAWRSADIDLDAAADKSIYAANDKIADRRPETYGIMALPYEQTPVFGVAEKPLIPSKSVAKVAAVQMHVTAETSVADVSNGRSHGKARCEGYRIAGIRVLAGE